MRLIDLQLDDDSMDAVCARARECGHRVAIVARSDDLTFVRVLLDSGEPDEFLEDLRGSLRRSACDRDGDDLVAVGHYAVLEPLAIEPVVEREEERRDETRAGTEEIEQFVEEGARGGRLFLVLSALAGAIATGGLIIDSPAVLVGAMVVAPLAKPIGVIGVGAFLGRLRAAARGLVNLALALGMSIVAGVVITLATPGGETTEAMLARSSISPFDLAIAACAGGALAISLVRRDATAIVGIVVAASIVPVAATVGAAAALGRADVVGGALFTMVSNVCGILLGLAIGLQLFRLRGQTPVERSTGERWGWRAIVALVALGTVLGGFGAWRAYLALERADAPAATLPADRAEAWIVARRDDRYLVAVPGDEDARFVRLVRVTADEWDDWRRAGDRRAERGDDSTGGSTDDASGR